MSAARVRRRAVRVLRSLAMTAPLDVPELARRLGEQRGRPIELVDHEFPVSTAFGLWLGTPTVDLVFYERHATPAHQQHIVLHELGHIVFDHCDGRDDDDVWRDLVPTLPPHVVRRALRRSAYDTASEHEAEVFASVLSEWTGLLAALPQTTGAPARLEGAFDDPRGWL